MRAELVEKMTGLSGPRQRDWITMYLGGEEVKTATYRREFSHGRYTWEEIALLASLDAATKPMRGPATKSA